jgi:hypothetical protein
MAFDACAAWAACRGLNCWYEEANYVCSPTLGSPVAGLERAMVTDADDGGETQPGSVHYARTEQCAAAHADKDAPECGCAGGTFCDHVFGLVSGNCGSCAGFADVCSCYTAGLPLDGADECARTCFTVRQRSDSDCYSPPTAPPALIAAGVQCTKAGGQYSFGYIQSLDECAMQCRAKAGCLYFVYGYGDNANSCHMEAVNNDDCGSNGYTADAYNLYRLGDEGRGFDGSRPEVPTVHNFVVRVGRTDSAPVYVEVPEGTVCPSLIDGSNRWIGNRGDDGEAWTVTKVNPTTLAIQLDTGTFVGWKKDLRFNCGIRGVAGVADELHVEPICRLDQAVPATTVTTTVSTSTRTSTTQTTGRVPGFVALDLAQCLEQGCCAWQDGACVSAAAEAGATCEAPSDFAGSIYDDSKLTAEERTKIALQRDALSNAAINVALQANLIKIDVYFESLWAETFTTEETFSLVSLIAQVGGNLGLFTGFSVATYMEFVEYFGASISWYIARFRDPQRHARE